ncbi:hypothetical protein [Micromonospora costi]|uniref:Uncharacterized protein n=1 Tax=Micromonospora costi TaxID=1530042 RepID=A0A3B0AA10_9ACTN|nr:hypothetical protein [Micromonospora costi]RKN56006.1 hypothetical protein D7193_15590 [Micromonospora costi]
MDRLTATTRRAARVAARSVRRAVTVEVTADDGTPVTRRVKPRRPSRQTADRAAIAASQLGIA